MAQVITEQDFPTNGMYRADLLTTKGQQIFANPDQLTQALNANPLLGGQYVLRVVTPGSEIVWQNPDTVIEISTPNAYGTQEYMYAVRVDDERETIMAENPITPTQDFRNKMNALKTVLENVGDGPAGAARRRKNRKTKKVSRRRRITRRR